MSAPAQADYPWHPSTDRLVKSALTHVLPQQLIGVLMTGMGNDASASHRPARSVGAGARTQAYPDCDGGRAEALRPPGVLPRGEEDSEIDAQPAGARTLGDAAVTRREPAPLLPLRRPPRSSSPSCWRCRCCSARSRSRRSSRRTLTGGSVSDALPALIGLVAAGALGSFAGTFQTLAQRAARRAACRQTTLDDTLDVTTRGRARDVRVTRVLRRPSARADERADPAADDVAGADRDVRRRARRRSGLTVALLVIEPLIVPILLVSALPLWLRLARDGPARVQLQLRADAGAPAALLPRRDAHRTRGREGGARVRPRSGPAAPLGTTATRPTWTTSRAHVRRRLLLALGGTLATVVVTSAAFALLIWFVLDDRIGLAEAGAAVLGIRLLGTRIEQVFKGVTGALRVEHVPRRLPSLPGRAGRRRQPTRTGSATPGAVPRARRRGRPLRLSQQRQRGAEGHLDADRAGEVIALVGENGSGKTTLAKLLGHALHADRRAASSGTARTSATLDREDVRRQVGVIFQDFVRYQLTARENIGYGRPEAVDDVDGDRRRGATGRRRRVPRAPTGRLRDRPRQGVHRRVRPVARPVAAHRPRARVLPRGAAAGPRRADRVARRALGA